MTAFEDDQAGMQVSASLVESVALAAQTGEVRDTWADLERAKSYVDYSPRVGLEEGLAREWA
jgi:nucleoside-diphosphate-sugar epimerase